MNVNRLKCVCLLVVMAMSAAVLAQSLPAGSLGLSDKELARRLVASEMKRSPMAWSLEGAPAPKWTYTIGLELEAMLMCVDADAYANTYLDALIDADGNICGYRRQDYKLDDINSGKLVMRMMERAMRNGRKPSDIQRLRHVADTLYSQFDTQPRTAEGGFWHKRIYPEQMWLDGLYMSAPFRVEYSMKYLSDASVREGVFEDVVSQFRLVYEHTLCPQCRLPHHAWDSAHKQMWADKDSGRSAHAWGRAVGWYMMALADVMALRQDRRLEDIFREISSVMLTLQDRQNGCWQQVLDCTGRDGNYFEMSASGMIAYSWLKGVRMGILPKKYGKAAHRTLEGIKREFLFYNNETGSFTLTNICAVAGLSDDRNGSYEYYINESRRDNDPKGMGPLIMALTLSDK